MAAIRIETSEQQAQPPGTQDVLADVLDGLGRPQKALPCRLFYDERGSELFDRICGLREYYVTRTETTIMAEHALEMAAMLGPDCLLIEYGSGSSAKTRILLDRLERPAGYVPIDISSQQLMRATAALRAERPDLTIYPVAGDFARPFELPRIPTPVRRRVVFFPGSTIGNFDPDESTRLLRQIAGVCGSGGRLLIGVDLRKSPEMLHAAYNDADGVTADFNLNMLVRLNRELEADFDIDAFTHRAVYDSGHSRIEMYLVSTREQTVTIAGHTFRFAEGESVLTEYSYKYTVGSFRDLATGAGFRPEKVWTDLQRLFSVHLFERV